MNTIVAYQPKSHYLNRSMENITEMIEGLGLITEEWRPVVGYERFYEVSSFGRVKSLNFKQKGRIAIVGQYVSVPGYLYVKFWVNKRYTSPLVHRLVAIAFLENPEKKRVVMHKFDNKKDNRVHLLKWGTHKENTEDAVKKGIMDLRGLSLVATPVGLYRNGDLVKTFDSQSKVAIELGVPAWRVSRAIKNGSKINGFNAIKH